jgi:hypothetical protein
MERLDAIAIHKKHEFHTELTTSNSQFQNQPKQIVSIQNHFEVIMRTTFMFLLLALGVLLPAHATNFRIERICRTTAQKSLKL